MIKLNFQPVNGGIQVWLLQIEPESGRVVKSWRLGIYFLECSESTVRDMFYDGVPFDAA